ncbi:MULTISPECIES: DUF7667 family protein [Geobacillus thermoleovorans group]|uniref:DUF7667 family protein n=1 Tax=Geobacillus thermoleovorans group TaxID=1505648 RepID=UPI003F5CC9EE
MGFFPTVYTRGIISRRRVYFSSKHPNLHQTILSMSREYGEIAKLKKLSLLAGMTGDVGWQHKLCARLKKLSR